MAICKIKDIAEEISVRVNDPKSSGYQRFVGLEHYIPGNCIIRNFGSAERLDSAVKEFKSGDILIARRNVYLKRAGIVYFDGVTSGDSIVLRAKTKLMQGLLPFILNTDKFWSYANQNADGSMSKRLSPKLLMDFEFSLPENIDKNEELADILWKMESLREAYETQVKASDDLVKSQFIEMFGNPISNDKGWRVLPLHEVAPEYSPAIPEQESYWCLNLDMIESYTGQIIKKIVIDKSEIGSSTTTFDGSMVLYSKLRPYLNKITVPDDYGYCTTELVGMKPNSSLLNKYFLFNLLRGDDFLNYANGISGGAQMPRMPAKALRDFRCIIPPISLQEQFVSFAEQTDKSKFEIKQSIENLTKMQKALINEVFA